MNHLVPEEELVRQIKRFLLGDVRQFPEVNGVGIGIDREREVEKGLRFVIYTESEITDVRKAEILKQVGDRFFEIKFAGKFTAFKAAAL